MNGGAVQEHFAVVGALVAAHYFQQSAFARAIFAEQRQHSAAFRSKAYIIKSTDTGIVFADTTEFQRICHRSTFLTVSNRLQQKNARTDKDG
jgi:hypothetical protein